MANCMKNLINYYGIIVSIFIISGCDSDIKNNIEKSGYNQFRTSDFGRLNPLAPPETKQWGQFAGVWDCISRDLDMRDDKEEWYDNKAIWKWEYVLGGHAILNQWWQEDRSPNPVTEEFFATGIFIFNPKTRLWEAVVLNSRPHKISPKFQAEYKDEKIKMHDGTGKWLVTFYDIKQNSFEWKYEVLTKNGDWKSISKISAVRKL